MEVSAIAHLCVFYNIVCATSVVLGTSGLMLEDKTKIKFQEKETTKGAKTVDSRLKNKFVLHAYFNERMRAGKPLLCQLIFCLSFLTHLFTLEASDYGPNLPDSAK